MYKNLPALTGQQIIKLLKKDGFYEVRKTKHGQGLAKILPNGRKIVTVVPRKRGDLTSGTYMAILEQAQISVERFLELLSKKKPHKK